MTMGGAETAIEAELTRIVRIAENVETYRHRDLRIYAYKILKEAFPDTINRERWRAMSGRDPDATLVREDGYTREQDRALLRQHGRQLCCEEHDRQHATELRQELADAQDEDEDEDEPEEDPPCDHGADSGEWLVKCRYCDAARDCPHNDRSCDRCDRCEAEHDCRDCGGDPDCEHRYECEQCGERL